MIFIFLSFEAMTIDYILNYNYTNHETDSLKVLSRIIRSNASIVVYVEQLVWLNLSECVKYNSVSSLVT